MNVDQGSPRNFELPAGKVLKIVAGAGASGTVRLYGATPGDAFAEAISISADTTIKRGPYVPAARVYQVTCDAASLTITAEDEDRLRDAINTLAGGDALLTAPGLAIGTTSAAKIKYNSFDVQVDGIDVNIAAGEAAFTATTHDIADPDAAGREAIYVLSIGKGDTVPTITKGGDAVLGAGVAPVTPTNHVKLGEVKVAHNGTLLFDASTDLLSAAHLTDTYTDATPTPTKLD